MMRRYLSMLMVAGVCAVGTSLAARGGLLIEWVASGGFTPSNVDLRGILDPTYNPSGSALAQLIFTTAAGPSPAQVGPGSRVDYSSGSDTVLSFFEVIAPPSSVFADFTGPQYQNGTYLNGSVFVRVFGRSDAAIDGTTQYWDGPLVPTLDKDITAVPRPTAQVIQANANTLPGGIGDPLNRTVQLIPEPSSLGMLALGAMALGWRRRRAN